MNATHMAVIGMLGTMSLGLSIPYFAKAGKDMGATFECTTSSLGERGSESCVRQGAAPSPGAQGNDFLRARSVAGRR